MIRIDARSAAFTDRPRLPAYLRKTAWLMGNIVRIMPSLGYIVICARKPAAAA